MPKIRQCKSLYNASIMYGQLYFEDALQCQLEDDRLPDLLDDKHLKTIRLLSLSNGWQQRVFLDCGVTIIEQIKFEMTLRKERRGQKDHWYAYRRVYGTLY